MVTRRNLWWLFSFVAGASVIGLLLCLIDGPPPAPIRALSTSLHFTNYVERAFEAGVRTGWAQCRTERAENETMRLQMEAVMLESQIDVLSGAYARRREAGL